MVRRNKRKKEEVAEDYCFKCKDGGHLLLCDYGDCLKAYHPQCVEKDDSFLESDDPWTCGSHSCHICSKRSKFKCFCCPIAVCGSCKYVEFAIVKGNKGFCRHCSKLAFLIEENADVDSDGKTVNFKAQDTYEGLFSEYYEIIKKEEGLNSLQVHSAYNFFKNCKKKCGMDPDEIGEGEDDTEESEDGSDFTVSDCDDLNDTAGVKSVRKKKCVRKLKSVKAKVKDKKKEFIGWGSRSLIEFLKYIGRDTSREFSEHDVASIIIEYCKEKKLFDSEKKRKVNCDDQLKSLLGRKSVNKNNIHNLLAPHFKENFDEMDDITSSPEDRDDNQPFNFSRERKLISSTKSCQKLVSEERQSCFAAIVSSNLKLVYLKRSLMEELLKQPETFDGKVLGSFVRIKSNPNDYLQRNSHLLVQVEGINRSSKNDEINKEILLQLSHVPKDVPICKISDYDFSEEECKDLYQRMRNGLLKQPTTLELEQKARSLHEDIIKHWIPRELVLLQNRIDHANEKGWRRELFEYLNQKLKLETPSEQSRLLSEFPKVIAEIVDTNLSPEGSPREDKLEQNRLPELAIGETCNSDGCYSEPSGFADCLNKKTDAAGNIVKQEGNKEKDALQGLGGTITKVYSRRAKKSLNQVVASLIKSSQDVEGMEAKLIRSPKTQVKENQTASQDKGASQGKLIQSTSKARQDDQKAKFFEELNSGSQTFNPEECSLPQPRNTGSGSGVDARNMSATRNAKQTMKEKQSFSVAEPVEVTVNDKQGTNMSAIPVGEQEVRISNVEVIELSDNDEQDANIADTSAGMKKAVENPSSCVWHCLGPYGERRGPFSMSALKRWSESVSYPLEYKVWKTGQSETQAILLTDALNRFFPI